MGSIGMQRITAELKTKRLKIYLFLHGVANELLFATPGMMVYVQIYTSPTSNIYTDTANN